MRVIPITTGAWHPTYEVDIFIIIFFLIMYMDNIAEY